MPNLSGKYRFNTRGGGTPEAVFLYKKLQSETRPFVYRSESKSWQIIKQTYVADEESVDGFVVIELPDNTGDYESLAKAKLRQRKTDRKDAPCVRGDEGDGGDEDSREIIVLWVFRNASYPTPRRMAMGFLSGFQGDTVGTPSGDTDADYVSAGISPILKTAYVFFDAESGGIGAKGYKPFLSVQDSVFCYNPPPEVKGKIGYSLSVNWHKEAYKSSGFYGVIESGGIGDKVPPERDSYASWADFFQQYDGEPYVAELEAAFQPTASMGEVETLNECGSDNLDGWWLYRGDVAPGESVSFRHVGDNLYDATDEFIVWRGSIDDYPAWLSYMESMLAYWGVLDNSRAESNLLGSMAINRAGAGSCASGAGSGYPPDTSTPALISNTEYYGRYCDVIINYQKNGLVKELTLPIDFPTRVTHIKYEHNEFLNLNLLQETEGQRIEEPYLAEWFSGRVNIDKNNIYVDIIYEIIREYESGLQVLPNGSMYRVGGNVGNYSQERPGIIGRDIQYVNDNESPTGETYECLYSQQGEQIYARALRDKFNKTVRYTIDKASFTITNTETFIGNHPITKGLFTDNFLQHNTILDISQRANFRQYNTGLSIVNMTNKDTPVISSPSPERIGYLGLPTPYFQLDCRPSVPIAYTETTIARPFPTNDYPIDYSAAIVNDFLTLKTDWDDTYWVFYLMMERPFLNELDPNKLVDFKDRCLRKGAGYKKNSNYYYLSYSQSISLSLISPIFPGFFEQYMEHERLRGYPIIKDGRIKKWLRLSPNSFPLFEPGGGIT